MYIVLAKIMGSKKFPEFFCDFQQGKKWLYNNEKKNNKSLKSLVLGPQFKKM